MIFKSGFWNWKLISGVVSSIFGAMLIVFAEHNMRKVSEAKNSIDHFNDFFTNSTGFWNPLIKFFGGEVHEKAAKYDHFLLILMIAGIVMVVFGIYGMCKRRR